MIPGEIGALSEQHRDVHRELDRVGTLAQHIHRQLQKIPREANWTELAEAKFDDGAAQSCDDRKAEEHVLMTEVERLKLQADQLQAIEAAGDKIASAGGLSSRCLGLWSSRWWVVVLLVPLLLLLLLLSVNFVMHKLLLLHY